MTVGLALLITVVLTLAVVAFVMAPTLVPLVVDPDPASTPASRATLEAARATAIATTRASILVGLAGVGALITIGINYRNSAIATDTFRVAERSSHRPLRQSHRAARQHRFDRNPARWHLRPAAVRGRHPPTGRPARRGRGAQRLRSA
jgi:hypothetical protein